MGGGGSVKSENFDDGWDYVDGIGCVGVAASKSLFSKLKKNQF